MNTEWLKSQTKALWNLRSATDAVIHCGRIETRFRLLPLLLTLTLALPVAAQRTAPASPPEIVAAQSALAASQPDSAIAILVAYHAKNPQTTAGRLLLGSAYRAKGDWDRALATYLAIKQPRQLQFQAMFAAAGIHAQRAQFSEALTLLATLKQSGAFDVELAKTAPDFASLRADPRFAGVMFTPADFQQPFVEPVHIIHEFVGETKGDQFSWIARSLGDVDGDDVADIVTSAPTYGVTAAATPPDPRGRVYVYSGRTRALLWTQTGARGEALGTGLEAAGDVNGDNMSDVVAGAPGGNCAYVYSGRDGTLLRTLRGTVAGESFGQSAASAGDQNADGIADVIVGAPASNAAGTNSGRVYVFDGRSGALLFSIDGEKAGDRFGSIVAGAKLGRGTPLLVGAPGAGTPRATAPAPGRVYVYDGVTRKEKFRIDAESTGGALGAMFTSLIGDVDGDGVVDVYASDFADAARGPATGRVYLHSGATGRRLMHLSGENAGDGFGIGSADVGDVNNDGFDDVLVGAWQYSSAAASGGRVYLYSGKDGATLRTITGRIPGETFGFDATGIGDVDGDGVRDLLVTSSWSNIRGFRTGRMFVISGAL